jgi:CRP-like cAMP-binding protein
MPSARPERLPVDPATAEAVAEAFKLEGFFPEFSAELCAKVFPHSGILHYRARETVIEQGESGRDLYLILAGEVVVEFRIDEMAAEAGRLGDGAVIGEMALLKDGVRSATVSCSKPVFAFMLAYEDVRYLLENNPRLAEHLTALARVRSGR